MPRLAPVSTLAVPEPTPADKRRSRASERATLEWASLLAGQARDASQRASALLAAASAMDPIPSARAHVEAVVSLHAAFDALADVLREIGE